MNALPAGEMILVIDDEMQIQRFLRVSLETHHYRVLDATTAQKGIDLVTSQRPHLIILDLGLPDQDGMDVLKRIREWSKIPIIILSARNEEDSVVSALECGADDYLTKPFAMRELLARIKVCLRRSVSAEDPIFQNGPLEVDFSTRSVRCRGEDLALTSTEYDLLKTLIRHAGKVLTHQQLLREVWGPNSVEHTHYLRVYMGHLRQKIEDDPTRPKILVTETGVGYRLKLIPTVSQQDDPV